MIGGSTCILTPILADTLLRTHTYTRTCMMHTYVYTFTLSHSFSLIQTLILNLTPTYTYILPHSLTLTNTLILPGGWSSTGR